MERKRFVLLDNIRAVLIILVVTAHVIPYFLTDALRAVYVSIYSYHMPAFVFLSGLCFRRNRTSLWKRNLAPCLFFQIIYLLEYAWSSGEPLVLQFTTPRQALWYLLSLSIWTMMTNTIRLEGRFGLFALGLSTAAGLLVGFDDTVGYYFSLSRTIVFFPFYLAGAWITENHGPAFRQLLSQERRPLPTLLLLLPALVTQGLLYAQVSLVEEGYLYCSMPYSHFPNYSIWVRCMNYIAAAAALPALFLLVPRKPLPLLTYLGRNTMPVYLMHTPALSMMSRVGLLRAFPGPNWFRVLWVALLLLVWFSLPPVVWLIDRLFRFSWLEKLLSKD